MSGAPGLLVSTADPTPPYEQLRRQLTALIMTGSLPPGERLPPLRQLAGDLGLAVGTVARAYRELEAAGLVRSRRGGGTRVAEHAGAGVAARDQALRRCAEEYVRQVRALGATAQECTDAVRSALDG